LDPLEPNTDEHAKTSPKLLERRVKFKLILPEEFTPTSDFKSLPMFSNLMERSSP
jgi:hypothetical protein